MTDDDLEAIVSDAVVQLQTAEDYAAHPRRNLNPDKLQEIRERLEHAIGIETVIEHVEEDSDPDVDERALELLEQISDEIESMEVPDDRLDIDVTRETGSDVECDVCEEEFGYEQTYKAPGFGLDRVCTLCVGSYLNHGSWDLVTATAGTELVPTQGKLRWASHLLDEAKFSRAFELDDDLDPGDVDDHLGLDPIMEEIDTIADDLEDGDGA